MTTPRGTYSGGYYTSPFFPDTPIYDSLVAERGTPQIAPIRVPAAYDTGSNLPALPSALPALPAAPSHQTPAQGTYTGYQQNGGYPQQPAQLQQAPAPYIPQQTAAPRGGYNGGYNGNQGGGYPQQQQAPNQYQGPAGYEAARPQPPRPAAPRPAAPAGYGEEPYQRRNLGQGYYQG
jgi:hypothetical protein